MTISNMTIKEAINVVEIALQDYVDNNIISDTEAIEKLELAWRILLSKTEGEVR